MHHASLPRHPAGPAHLPALASTGHSAGVAEETLLRHLLFPNDRIRPGFETTVVKTKSGSAVAGLLTNDGPTSVTLALPAGLSHTTLRKDIESVQRLPNSMMPGFAGVLTPADAADLLAWLKTQLQGVK